MLESNEKSPILGAPNVRDRIVYIIRDDRQERTFYGFFLGFFTIFFIYYLFFLTPLPSGDGDAYHYYLMTKRWPAGECNSNNHCVRNLTKYDKWVIHGLWPEFSNNTWDQFCTKSKFNISLVEDLRSDLLQYWPNLLDDKTVESLWAHEWEKHGTCSPLTQHQYFDATLKFHRNYDITKWLTAANIKPSNTRQYTEAEIRAAIGQHVDSNTVQLNCDHHHKGSILKEIYFCVSFDDAQSLVPCTVKSTCSHSPFFYPSAEN